MTTATGSGYVPGFLGQLTSGIERIPNIFVYNDHSLNPNWANSQIWQVSALATGATGGDAIATINGSNYFSDGQKRGMDLGDLVIVVTDYVAVGTPVTHLCYVSALQATTSGYGVTTTLIPNTT
jgi:hypothetical protein